jgi:hypothetical protein
VRHATTSNGEILEEGTKMKRMAMMLAMLGPMLACCGGMLDCNVL